MAIPRFPRYDASFLLAAPGVAEEMGELWREAARQSLPIRQRTSPISSCQDA
ncbi:hypothetical protein [Streptomyces sp. YIM S03343]